MQFTGLAVREGEALQQAIVDALDALIADGSYRALLAKWKLTDYGVEGRRSMLDSKRASIPPHSANTAPAGPDSSGQTPGSAMFLSFDVDAESAWTSKEALHAQRLITMSYGGLRRRSERQTAGVARSA